MKVLLIDDSRTIRNIQKNLLAQLGYENVVEACNGTEGLKEVSCEKPDLIFVDWNMPDMSGIEFLQKLRVKNIVTPALICPTEAEKPRVSEALEAGADDYIVKPFSVETLSSTIREAVDKTRAASA